MFATAFDLDVAEVTRLHPKSTKQAYTDIRKALTSVDYECVQGSVDVQKSGDPATLHLAIAALRALPWFGGSVRDIRAFRVENFSDFTPIMKSSQLLS